MRHREAVAKGDTRHSPQRTPATGPPPVRIFAFGASTMWGSDVRDDHTIASYLSKLLYARGYRAQVTNYGQLGYVSTQAAILLLRSTHRGEIPDIVLLYDGVNDLIASHTHGEGVAEGDTRRGPGMDRHFQRRPAVERDGLLRHSHGAAGVSVNEWLRRAEFDLLNRPQGLLEHTGRQLLTKGFWGFNRLRVSLRRRIRSAPEDRSRSRPLGNELARRTLHVYAANLAAVESLGHRYGFEPLFYWQPNIFSKRHRSPREQAAARRLLLSEKVYDDLYRRVRRSGILNNHPRFHDISGLFDHREEPYYVDMWHLSEAGNRLVAEKMVEDVIALIEQRRAAAAEKPAT
ncbi:MAG: hypothetical protein LGR52_05420 [Candidatus Thiosymbion ectosymbiont of Robbea hypermnestra]|nr:hypothetical protein [Candidatus Thiosymbion ectosymbiont of Robbea hypermnestra]